MVFLNRLTAIMNEELKKRIEALENWKSQLESSHSIPLNIDQAFRDRFAASGLTTLAVADGGTGATTLTGILKGNGTSPITTITPLAGTKVYYVADSSGGAVTRKLTFTDGVLTAET